MPQYPALRSFRGSHPGSINVWAETPSAQLGRPFGTSVASRLHPPFLQSLALPVRSLAQSPYRSDNKMRFTTALILPGLLAAAAQAAVFPGDDSSSGGVVQERDACPQVWYKVSKDLGGVFTSSEVQVKDKDGNGLTGRNIGLSALRLVFHDCMAGACDGSVQYELDRPENKGAQLQSSLQFLVDKAKEYGTSVADMIVFASRELPIFLRAPPLHSLTAALTILFVSRARQRPQTSPYVACMAPSSPP